MPSTPYPGEPTAVATHCPYCALQCAQTLTRTPGLDGANGVTVEGRAFPTNGGGLCQKGWTSAEVLTSTGPAHRPARARQRR